MIMLSGSVMVATALALLLLGGGLYEYLVVDPFWPKRPDLIQPNRGGISRRRFWFPIHTLFEAAVILALVQGWNLYELRFWLLMALAGHATTRIWSALDFIPKALAFEKAVMVNEMDARKWTKRSRLRFPLEVLTCVFMFAALRIV